MKVCVYTSVKRMKDEPWRNEIKSQLPHFVCFFENIYICFFVRPQKKEKKKHPRFYLFIY